MSRRSRALPDPRTTPRRPGRFALRGASAALALGLLIAGCSDDGPLSDVPLPTTSTSDGDSGAAAPPETAPPETAPPETAPPETAPPETAPPETEAEDDGGISTEAVLIVLLLGVGALLLFLLISRMSSSSKTPVGPGQQPSRLTDLLSGSRWVHDRASMEILRTTDPAQLSRTWQANGPRIVELEGWAAALAMESTEPATATALQNLGRATAGLRSALESDVALRTDPAMADRDDLVRSSALTVEQRRNDVNVALANPALRAG